MKQIHKDEFQRIGGKGAIDVTIDFLETYIAYLEDEQSYASNTIRACKEALDEIPTDYEDLINEEA